MCFTSRAAGFFPPYGDPELRTIVFKPFVGMQILNELNDRRLDNNLNVFEGMHRNKIFMVINTFMGGLQVPVSLWAARLFPSCWGGIRGLRWAVCLVLAFLSLPWAVSVHMFPDAVSARIGKIACRPVVILHPVFRLGSRAGWSNVQEGQTHFGREKCPGR